MLKVSELPYQPLGTETNRDTAAEYKAIFLSVDVPVLGQRLNEHKNKFELPAGLQWPNLTAVGEGLEYGRRSVRFLDKPMLTVGRCDY